MAESRPEWVADVKGACALFDWFGYWPDFHDAEIISVEPNRRDTSALRVHIWEMMSEVDDKGYFRLRKHVLVTFLLDGVRDLELSGFSHQNVIYGLEISRADSGFRLELDPCYWARWELDRREVTDSNSARQQPPRVIGHAVKGSRAMPLAGSTSKTREAAEQKAFALIP
jgi:Immunity protein 50